MFRESFLHVERSDTGGGPGIPDDIQHCSRLSGKGGPAGSMKTPGNTTWVWMVGGRAQHLFLCRLWRIAGRNPIWVHTALISMARMLERVGINNLRKTKSMV